MAISKIVDNRKYERKTVETCQKNSEDCMYLNKADGTCRAEWCIFKELPEMVKLNIKLTCGVCKKNTTTVSAYSSERKYICPECLDKLYDVIVEPKCGVCKTPIAAGEYLCSSCATKIKALYTHTHY